MKSILITGADFRNKGGQSMLFITIHELRKRMPNCTIYYPTSEKIDRNFRVTPVFYNYDSLHYMHGGINRVRAIIRSLAKGIVKKSGSIKQIKELSKIYPTIDAIVDISGYNLSSKWNDNIHFKYLEYIRQAQKFNIPVYLMPQSFGPFDYPAEKKNLLGEINRCLQYPQIIFAREKEGYQMLTDTFHLKNVVLSTDLVLQNSAVDLQNIYNHAPELQVPELLPNAVGIVPNKQCFAHGNKQKIIQIYICVIRKLLESEKEIYIFRHSTEDLGICKEIFALFSDKHVHLLENDFSCLEYDELVKQFDFIVCSRYHGNVHAYRNCIPSVLLGWAVKYKELAQLLGQDEYSFDITDKGTDAAHITRAVVKMSDMYSIEAETIRKNLEIIRKGNCFDQAFGVVDR